MLQIGTNEEYCIRITHSISPHQFYFKLEYPLVDNSLEHVIDYCERMFPLRMADYSPSVGDFVAVYISSWKKWVRAIIDHVFAFLSGEREYALWSIDEGVPLIVNSKMMLPLPRELCELPEPAAYLGGLAPHMPIKEEFNYDQMLRTKSLADNWSPYAVQRFEEIIQNADSLRFMPRFKEPFDNHYLGHLNAVQFTGKVKNIGVNMVLEGTAMLSQDFMNDFQRIKPAMKARWSNNANGGYSMSNKMLSVSVEPKSKERMTALEPIDYEVHEKVADWMRRNDNMPPRPRMSAPCGSDEEGFNTNSEGHSSISNGCSMSIKDQELHEAPATGRHFNSVLRVFKLRKQIEQQTDPESTSNAAEWDM